MTKLEELEAAYAAWEDYEAELKKQEENSNA